MKKTIILHLLFIFMLEAYGQTAYIGSNGNYIHVVDIQSSSIVDSIYVSQNCKFLAISHDESKVYVSGCDSLKVINTSTNTVTQAVYFSQGWNMCVSLDDSKLFVRHGYSSLVKVQTSSMTYFGSITVGAGASGVSCNSNNRVYVSNDNDNNVSVVDIPTSFVIANIGVYRPRGMCLNSNASKLYIASNHNVLVINTSNNAIIASIPFSSNINANEQLYGIAISPDDSKVYVTSPVNDSVGVINTLNNTLVAKIPVGNNPLAIAVTPDGTKVLVANAWSNTVSVINTLTNTVISTITGFNFPGQSLGNFIISSSPSVNIPLNEDDKQIYIFPNPSNGKLNINLQNYSDNNGYKIKIINPIGQIVYLEVIKELSVTVDLDVKIRNGIYFVHIIDGQGNTIDIKKIVLQ